MTVLNLHYIHVAFKMCNKHIQKETKFEFNQPKERTRKPQTTKPPQYLNLSSMIATESPTFPIKSKEIRRKREPIPTNEQ